MSHEQHRLLHTLAIRGLIDSDDLAIASGLDRTTVDAGTGNLLTDGLIVRREGRMEGFMLTPDGRAAHEASLVVERASADLDALQRADAQFVEINAPFKQLCTDWQLAEPAGRHTDELDEALAGIHANALAAVATAEQGLDRFSAYDSRLKSAFDRFSAGDDTALLRPLSGSYHDVWMELHHDLLLTIGRSRGEGDGH